MTFGFEVLDGQGNVILDQDSYSIVGRKMQLSSPGEIAIPVTDSFVAVGIYGASLRNRSVGWRRVGNTVYIKSNLFRDAGVQPSFEVVIFEIKSSGNTSDVFGMEVYAADSSVIFSSSDIHFKFLASMQVATDQNAKFDYTILNIYPPGSIYILHSQFPGVSRVVEIATYRYEIFYRSAQGLAIVGTGSDADLWVTGMGDSKPSEIVMYTNYPFPILTEPNNGEIVIIKGRVSDDKLP